jgi:drug/metabolite transporter (DMT)-like permease
MFANLYWRGLPGSVRSVGHQVCRCDDAHEQETVSVLLAALSALCYGAADYTGGRATRRSPVFSVLLVSQLSGLLGILIAAPFVPDTIVKSTDLLWGAAAGASGVIGLALLYRALATTVAAIASPAAALVGAAAPVVAGALVGEQPGTAGWIGIAVAVPAVLFLTAERRSGENPRKALALGTVAGLCFGAFFVLIAQTTDDSGLWPLAASKVASIVVAVVVNVALRLQIRLNRPSVAPAVSAGILDMAANVFFLVASRIGLLAVSGVVSSLYPAPTVMLATVLDRQRLTPLRAAGLVLALAGVALMTL